MVPVAIGAAAAVGLADPAGPGPDTIVWWRVVAALVVSLALQVGVNYANDYSDGVRGSDDERVGPRRLVASGLARPAAVKRAALLAFGVAAVAGLAVAAATTWWLVAIGAVSILAAWGYTGGPRPYGYAGLGEIFVFVFFGLVATVGTTFVAVERISWTAIGAGVAAGSLSCALLVVNNLRDLPSDRAVGKRTLAVRFGDPATRLGYTGLVVLAFLAAAVTALDRPTALLAVLAIPFAVGPVRQVRRGVTGPGLIPVLGATGRLQLAFGASYAIGLALGG